jgi:hypothetical protein
MIYQIFFNFFAKKFRRLYYRQISVCAAGAPNMVKFRHLQQGAPLQMSGALSTFAAVLLAARLLGAP